MKQDKIKRWLARGAYGVFIVLCLVGLGEYANRQFAYRFFAIQKNEVGRALSAAVELSYGRISSFPEYHIYKDILSRSMIEQCKDYDKNHANVCLLASPYGPSMEAFYKHCATWRFEHCAHVSANPLFFKNKKLKVEILKILSDPCKYLPPHEEVVRLYKALDVQDAPLSAYPNDFKEYARDLGCSTSHKKKLKLIVSYGNEATEIMFINIGE